jgi:hypothetical protein
VLCLSNLAGSSEPGRGFGSARASLSTDRQLALQPGEGLLQVGPGLFLPLPSPSPFCSSMSFQSTESCFDELLSN